MSPVAGDRLGRWTLVQALGSGSFGTTWTAHDPLGRHAAIKLLSEAPGDEVRALGSLCHPAIPTLYEAGGGAQPFIAMEKANGRGLDTLLRARPAPEEAALRVFAVLIDALAHVHAMGLTHGDVKPENIIVERIADQRLWLVDFGMVGGSGGTLHYAAPERVRGEPASGPADVYAAGLVLYEMLHQHLPWAEEGLGISLARRRTTTPEATKGSPWVRQLLHEILAPEPSLRPPAASVADTLDSHGVPLPRIDGAIIRRRARSLHIARESVDLENWLSRGGRRSLKGQAGTGRSHHLARAALELQARGLPFVQVRPGVATWQAVRAALEDPNLPGPPAALPPPADIRDRAERAANLLIARSPGGLRVLVDDEDLLPEPDRLFVEALGTRRGVHLLRAGAANTETGRKDDIFLHSFCEAEVEKLVQGLLGSPGPRDFAAALTELGAGLPGPIVDLVAQAADAGAILRRSGGWVTHPEAWATLRASAQTTCGRPNLPSLAPHELIIASALALFETPVSLSDLHTLLSDGSGHPVPEGVAGLADRGLLRTDAQGRIQLDDNLLARNLRASASPDLHRRVTLHLVAEPASLDAHRAIQAGRHLLAAGDAELAEQLGTRLLESARGVLAEDCATLAVGLWALAPSPALATAALNALVDSARKEDAARIAEEVVHFGTLHDGLRLALAARALRHAEDADGCLSLLDGLNLPNPLSRLQARQLRLEALFKKEAHEQVAAGATSLDLHALERDAGPELADAALGILRAGARSLILLGRPAEAEQLLERVPENLGRGRGPRAHLEATRGLALYKQGRLREAGRCYSAAGGEDAGLSPELRAQMMNNAGVLAYTCGDRDEAMQRWETALLRFETLGNKHDQVRVLCNLSVAYGESARWERARAVGERGHQEAVQLGAWDLATMCAGNLGDLALHQHQFGVAERWYDLAESLSDTHQFEGERVELARRRAELAVLSGQPDAEERCKRAFELANQRGEEVEATRCRALCLVCEAERLGRGEAHRIQSEFDALMAHLSQAGVGPVLARVRLLAARAAIRLEQGELAHKLIEAAASFAKERGLAPTLQEAERLRREVRSRRIQDVRLERFHRAMSLTAAVNRERDPETLLNAIAAAGLEMLNGERCFVMLRPPGGGNPQTVRALNSSGTQEGGEPSRGIIEQVLSQARPVIAGNIAERGDLRDRASVNVLALRCAVCVPILEGQELLGLIYVDSRQQGEDELGELAGLLQSLGDHAAVALTHARTTTALAARSRRVAELAHDIRSPLGSAISLIDELAEKANDPAMSELRGLLEKSLAMARRMLDDKPAEIVTVDAVQLVRDTCVPLRRDAERQGRRLRCVAQGNMPVALVPSEFVRILQNLVGNALKFAPLGTAVRCTLLESDSGGLTLTVEDEGPGFPEDILKRFGEWGAKGTSAASGFGYGLAIVRSLVADLGGELSAENRINPAGRILGANLVVRLPAALRVQHSQSA